MLEFEKKFMLSPEEYRILYQAFDAPVHTQTNFYYDTQNLFYNSQGITCRIRAKGGRYKATIKEHRLHTSLCSEERVMVVKDEYDTSLFTGMNLLLQGKLQTVRKTVNMPGGVCLALDRNLYLGMVDYELEMEYDPQFEISCDDALHIITRVLSEQGLTSSEEEFYNRMKCSRTKSERFFAQKIKIEGGA